MRTFRLLIAAAAWLSLAFIVFATVVPIGFRPHDPFSVNVDRGLAFAVMAGLFVLAYPRRWRAVLVLNLAGAGAIEALQLLAPTRHAHLFDAAVKAGGALAGVLVAAAINHALRRRRGKARYIISIETDTPSQQA